jgi:MoaA/NifB/PqqE/SkfB family radical SAM enzyme
MVVKGFVYRVLQTQTPTHLLGINRLTLPPDLPVTLQGGEPTVHKDFYEIVAEIKPELNLDLLTNLEFDVEEFMAKVEPSRMRREAPYASIRVSYHRGQAKPEIVLQKALKMQKKGYSIVVWGIRYEKTWISKYCAKHAKNAKKHAKPAHKN